MEAGSGEDAATVGWHGDGETEREVGIGGGHIGTQDDAHGGTRGLTDEKINDRGRWRRRSGDARVKMMGAPGRTWARKLNDGGGSDGGRRMEAKHGG